MSGAKFPNLLILFDQQLSYSAWKPMSETMFSGCSVFLAPLRTPIRPASRCSQEIWRHLRLKWPKVDPASRLEQMQTTWLDTVMWLERLQTTSLVFNTSPSPCNGIVAERLNVTAAVMWLLSELIVSTFRNRSTWVFLRCHFIVDWSLLIKLLRSHLSVCETRESNFSCCSEGSTSVAIWTASVIMMRYALLNKNFQWSDTFTFTLNRLCGVFNLCNDDRHQAKMRLFRTNQFWQFYDSSENSWRTSCSSQRIVRLVILS